MERVARRKVRVINLAVDLRVNDVQVDSCEPAGSKPGPPSALVTVMVMMIPLSGGSWAPAGSGRGSYTAATRTSVRKQSPGLPAAVAVGVPLDLLDRLAGVVSGALE